MQTCDDFRYGFLKIERKLALLKDGTFLLLLDYNHCIVVWGHLFLTNNTNPLNQILMKYHINQVSIQTYTSFTSDILNEAAVSVCHRHLRASLSFSPEFQQPAGWRPFFGSPVKNKEFRKEIRERLVQSGLPPKICFGKSDHLLRTDGAMHIFCYEVWIYFDQN